VVVELHKREAAVLARVLLAHQQLDQLHACNTQPSSDCPSLTHEQVGAPNRQSGEVHHTHAQ
jgi:hypothetical protein